jgi:hypothetical protein
LSEVKMRTVWKGTIGCDSCGVLNEVHVQKKIIVPAEPAETELIVTVRKASQATLD